MHLFMYASTVCVYISSEIIKEKCKRLSKRRKGKEGSDGCILLLIYNCLLPTVQNSLCCPGTKYITHIFAWLCVQ